MTLLVKSRWPISNTIGVSFTRGISSVSLAFKHRMQNRLSTHFCINQQSYDILVRWWGINSTLLGKHQLDQHPGPHVT
jgi:hypothetical protein